MFKELKMEIKTKGLVGKNIDDFFPCLYMVTKDVLVIEKEIREDMLNKKKVFKWDRVVLNLPSMKGYYSTRPWVYKARNDER